MAPSATPSIRPGRAAGHDSEGDRRSGRSSRPLPCRRLPWASRASAQPYFKGAYGNVLLREQILGPERFDWAFRKYIRDWAFKHPSPSDFFRAMQSEGGGRPGMVLAWMVREQLEVRSGGGEDRRRDH